MRALFRGLLLAIALGFSLVLVSCPEPAPDAATYTVTFDSQGGSAVSAVTGVAPGSTITQPADPVYAAHTFGTWYRAADFLTPWSFNVDTVQGDMTLYAKWTLTTYTVTFDSQGGSAVAPIAGVEPGSTITQPADPTYGGCLFGSWYRAVDYLTLWDFNVDTVQGDTTLFAQWLTGSASCP